MKEEPVDESKLGLVARFKLMYKQYWYVLIPVHWATSAVWYGSFFIAAKKLFIIMNSFHSGVEIVPMLEAMGVTSDKILSVLKDSNAGYYAIAYAMYKLATPARYTVTLAGTTYSINYLKKRGYIKPVPSKEQLRTIYEDKREEMRGKRDELMDKLEERRGELRDKFEERREELRDMIEERRSEMHEKRNELTKRLQSGTKEMKNKIAERSDEIKEKLEQNSHNLQQSLESSSSKFKRKVLDESRKIQSHVPEIGRKD
ncbi:hypothetical protein HAZT_HAZT001394 [Hyalella azteca]|uniref:DUF1279 domain-containing protein n=1 Tax=Hyalella azteca TaxID=294128 RepID=A0A6A0GRK6_HYAAZ|nr:hypothetical protein HAZT_HAZT001394 [Hyalella azteca]